MLKLIDRLPHVASYKRRWVRRSVIVLTLPVELVRSAILTFHCAGFWWRQP